MMMTAQTRIGTPIVPRNKADPTQSSRQVSRMFNDIEDRYLNIKRRLKALFDLRLTGQQREANAQQSRMMCNNEGAEPSLYQVNAGKFVYDMTAAELADLLRWCSRFWMMSFLKAAVRTCGRWTTSLRNMTAAR